LNSKLKTRFKLHVLLGVQHHCKGQLNAYYYSS